MVRNTPPSHDVSTHQIWNSYLKEYRIWKSYLYEYRRYAPDTLQFLETSSEVKFKVTVTQLWYGTLCHPKMHPHTKFEIPATNNIRGMPRTGLFQARSEVKIKVTVTRKWYAALHNPKMYPHTKFGIPTSNNIGDRLRTQ